MRNGMIIHPDELSRSWIDRLASAGVNTLGIHPVGGKEATESLRELVALCGTREFRELIDYANERGLEVEYEIHAAGYLMPRELFSEHPEYFRENADGERVGDHNFCVSNPEALEYFAKRAVKLAEELYGSSSSYYFWMDDGREMHCHCRECRKYTPSDQHLIAWNAALREIKKHKPAARMAYLAYMDAIVPPVNVKPEPGVFLEYAPFYKHTSKGRENGAELLAKERAMIEPLMHFFEGAEKKVLEYWYDNSLFSGHVKPPKKFTLNEQMLRSDVIEYREMGFDRATTFACYLGADYDEMFGAVDITPFAECEWNG